MGRIKNLPIKKITRKLIANHRNFFTENFEDNKKIVAKILKTDKKTRNSVAGYIARLIKKENKKINK